MKLGRGEFWNGDCLELMRAIPDGAVDMVLCDLPYGTTDCSWDSVIPFNNLWAEYWRVCKPNAAVVLTAQQPFTAALTMSQPTKFRHNWVWDKGYATGFANANKMPMKGFEDVLVFYRSLPTYNPQGLTNIEPKIKKRPQGGAGAVMGKNSTEGKEYVQSKTGYPNGIIRTAKENGWHPTQKPVALFEYLIATYTNDGDLVLDNTAGSGTTAIAAENMSCRWICIERDPDYYAAAIARVYDHVSA